jgi:hypothetical protein
MINTKTTFQRIEDAERSLEKLSHIADYCVTGTETLLLELCRAVRIMKEKIMQLDDKLNEP